MDVTNIQIEAEITDASNGSEDVALKIGLRRGGSFVDALSFDPTETVFNDTGADIDFRVESDDYPYCLFVNSTQDNVAIGFSAEPVSQTPGLVILSEDQSGGVVLIKEDGSQPSSGEGLGSFGWQGFDDTNSMNAADARITAFAAENHSGSDAATFMSFYTKTTSQGPGNGPTEVFRLTQAGEAIVQTGDLYFATAGKGIVLGATTNVDANTLDDYEEGVYTATMTATTSGTITLNGGVNLLAYTKVGRVIHVQGLLETSAKSSPEGAVRISLPVATADLSEYAGRLGGSITFSRGGGAATVSLPFTGVESSSVITLSVDASTVHPGGSPAYSQFYISFTYIA